MSDDLRLLSPREVAEMLGIKQHTLARLCQHGELSYIDVGGGRRDGRRKYIRRMFERQDVEKFIARRRRTEQWVSMKRERGQRRRAAAIGSEPVSFVELLKQRQREKEKSKGK
jgi:excisionase family DNA binding protein